VFGPAEGTSKGAYVLSDAPNPDAVLIGTGSEVHIALAAQKLLDEDGVSARVVSMPSWELFEKQPASYRKSVLPPELTARVSVEAGASMGWERYVGLQGAAVGLARYGASAPYQTIYRELGISAEAVSAAAMKLLSTK
jgi:transketolase